MKIVVPLPFGAVLDDEVINTTISDLASAYAIAPETVLASMIGWFASKKTALGRLLQFCIDVASDEYCAEEFYLKYKSLLPFLAIAGSGDEEVRYRAYMGAHPDVFICKSCKHELAGGCPIVECPTCGRSYHVVIDGISSAMCERCSAQKIGECTELTRKTLFKIYAI